MRTRQALLGGLVSLAALIPWAAPAQEPAPPADPSSHQEESGDRGGGATGAELTSLRTAMEIAFLDTSLFHTLENLDDLPQNSSPTFFFNDINNAGAGTPVLLEATGRFLPVPRFLGALWRGPYITYQQDRIELDEPIEYDLGTPLDFFDQPYRLYSPLGLVDPVTETIVLDAVGDRFDRWTILSAGPDQLPGTADDATRQFGGAPTVAVMSGVIPLPEAPDPRGGPIYATNATAGPIPAGSLVLIRGYNFGASQGSSRLLLDDADLGPAQSWTGTQIVIQFPSVLIGETLHLEMNGTIRDSLPVQVILAAEGWERYE
jgi:hypothetical protein